MRKSNTLMWFSVLMLTCAGTLAQAGTVDFVSCPANGTFGPLAPPIHSGSVFIPGAGLSASLAYYKASEGVGVFAPVGWQCREWYGSGEITLVVAPHAVSPSYGRKINGPAVTVTSIDGGTSGMIPAEQLISQLFPKQDTAFVKWVKSDEKGDYFPLKNYSRPFIDKKIFHRVSPTLLEFTASASRTAFGAGGKLSAVAQSSGGMVMLVPPKAWPGVIIVRVRLPASQGELLSVILKLMVARHSS